MPEQRVEEQKPLAVVTGGRLLCRAIAHLPAGRVVASRTFVTAIE